MRRWARGAPIARAGVIGLAALGALGAVVLAAPGDGAEQAARGREVTPPAFGPRTSSTTSTLPPTTSAPPVEVRGIAVQRDGEPTPAPPTTVAPSESPEVTPPPAPEPAPPPCPTGNGDFVTAHNSIRCPNGLSTLGVDPSMNDHAQFHAQRLLEAGACASLFHSSELPSWYGSGGAYWGENAACMDWSGGCWSDVGRVMDGWMASPEHRPNILDPHFNWMGVGIACDGRHTYFVVQFRS